jgi:hypothetical protein
MEANADVILAEFGGQGWLVRGEEHIDDLLNNTLPPDVTIAVIACESKSMVDSLWQYHGGGDNLSDMWLIHPGIVNRARGQAQAAAGEVTIGFAAWSAAIDEAAQRGLHTAATLLTGSPPGASIVIIRHVAEAAPAMATDMANLRSGLIEAQFATMGIDASRLSRETRPGAAEDADRILLLLRGG